MSRYVLARGVRIDLREIWRHVGVEHCSPDAADRLVDRITNVFALLAREPLLGEARDDLARGVRAFVVRPYLVLYTPEAYGIRVIQVTHSARDIYRAFRG